MVREEYENYIRNNWQDMVKINKNHTNLHYGKTSTELMLRRISENKDACSSFSDKDTMDDYMGDVFFYCGKEIAAWLATDKKDTETITLSKGDKDVEYNNVAFTARVDFSTSLDDDSYLGTMITDKEEILCSEVFIKLEKYKYQDENGTWHMPINPKTQTPYIDVITFYPCPGKTYLSKPLNLKPNNFLTMSIDNIDKLQLYIQAIGNDTQKDLFEIRRNIDYYTSEQTLNLSTKTSPYINMYINGSGITIKERTPRGNKRIDTSRLYDLNPQMYDFYTKIESARAFIYEAEQVIPAKKTKESEIMEI